MNIHKLQRLALITGILFTCLFGPAALFTARPIGASLTGGEPLVLTPPPTPLPNAGYYGIIAHRDDCPNNNTGGIHFTGNNDIFISGGSIQSHACLEASGSVNVTVNGNIEYATYYNPSGNPSLNPEPEQITTTYPITVENFVDCSGLPASSSDGDGTVSPGIYEGIAVSTGETLTMTAGLYCFTNDFDVTGGTVTGDGVTLYFANGDFISDADPHISLSAPLALPNNPNEGYLGLLMVMANENGGDILLEGILDSSYTGTIYAGHEDSTVEVGGSYSIDNYAINIFAGTVFLHGSYFYDVTFPKIYSLPLEKTAPATIHPGERITYTLTITNLHNFTPIFDVVLTDTIPAGTTFITATLPFTCTGDTLTWALDPLPHPTVWQVQMVVQVPLTTTLPAIVNETYGLTGEGAYPSIGQPVTTTIDYSGTVTPTPTQTEPPPTPTPTLTPTPTPSPTVPPSDPFRFFLPILFR